MLRGGVFISPASHRKGLLTEIEYVRTDITATSKTEIPATGDFPPKPGKRFAPDCWGSSPVDLFDPPAAGGSPPLAHGRPVVPPFLSLAKGRLPLDLKRNPSPSVAS